MQNHQNELVKEEVTAENISEVIAKWTEPSNWVTSNLKEKIVLFQETERHHRVVGQEEA